MSTAKIPTDICYKRQAAFSLTIIEQHDAVCRLLGDEKFRGGLSALRLLLLFVLLHYGSILMGEFAYC